MGSKWKDRPIFVGLDDVLIEDEAQDGHRVPEPLSSSSNWPSVPQHEPSNSRFDKPSDYTSPFKHPEARIHDYSASYLPSTPQQEASGQTEDERYKYSSYHERFPHDSLIFTSTPGITKVHNRRAYNAIPKPGSPRTGSGRRSSKRCSWTTLHRLSYRSVHPQTSSYSDGPYGVGVCE